MFFSALFHCKISSIKIYGNILVIKDVAYIYIYIYFFNKISTNKTDIEGFI